MSVSLLDVLRKFVGDNADRMPARLGDVAGFPDRIGLEAETVSYLLRATFDADDQSFANAQVLDTEAEGVQDGQLTVVEVDGTLAISSNKCAFTAQSTPAWGDQGFFSGAITRAIGTTLFGDLNSNLTTKKFALAFIDSADVSISSSDGSRWFISFNTDAILFIGLNDQSIAGLGDYSALTDYTVALMLGGYDANGVPYQSGDIKANFTYGCNYFIKGGAFTDWTLLYRTGLGNDTTIYAAFSNRDVTGTVDDFKIPDADLSALLQPIVLDTFTDSNGTALEDHTPDVGSAGTALSGTWEIQSNEAEKTTGVLISEFVWESSNANIVSEGIITFGAVTSNDRAGIMLRSSDVDNFWLGMAYANTDEIRIYEVNAGGYTVRASTSQAIAVAAYRFVVIGDTQNITMIFDDDAVIAYASASHNQSETKHGLYTYNSTISMDNFAVYPRGTGDEYSDLDNY